MSEDHKKACGALKYFEHFLSFISGVSDCVSIVGVPVVIASAAVGIKICAITDFERFNRLIY